MGVLYFLLKDRLGSTPLDLAGRSVGYFFLYSCQAAAYAHMAYRTKEAPFALPIRVAIAAWAVSLGLNLLPSEEPTNWFMYAFGILGTAVTVLVGGHAGIKLRERRASALREDEKNTEAGAKPEQK